MADISWADGQRILELARQHLAGSPPPAPQQQSAPESVLSDDQAHALQMWMLATGHDASTVGRGSVLDGKDMNNGRRFSVPPGGAEGSGDAPGVFAPGSPDSGPDSQP